MAEKPIRDTFTITIVYDRLSGMTSVAVLALPGEAVDIAEATAALVAAIRTVPMLVQQQIPAEETIPE